MTHWFACEIEESVFLPGAKTPVESKRDRGFARAFGSINEGFEIEASSEPVDDESGVLGRSLPPPRAPDLSRLPDNITARVLARSSISTGGDDVHIETISAIGLSAGEFRVIASPESLEADARFVADLARREHRQATVEEGLPIAWFNGSGAVLLHEAIGHPAERSLFVEDLPDWLQVDDDPNAGSLVRLQYDDTGRQIGLSMMSHREPPAAIRRWSHRDVPMRRLTNLVSRGSGDPLSALPSTRIDVLLVGHGHWDSRSDEVAVRVAAADLVDGTHRTAVAPFVFRAPRLALPSMLAGWFGELTRHPGVLCGEEGVTLPVGSTSVGLLTRARA